MGNGVTMTFGLEGGNDGRRRLGATWRRIVEAAGGLVYPSDCLVCGRGLGGRREAVCDGCRGEVLDAAGTCCPRCAMTVGPFADLQGGCGTCRGRRLGFDGAVALGPYQGPIRHLCLTLKRVEGAWVAPRLAELLIEARGEVIRGSGAAVVVPVPLHWSRRWRRGYDQAEALAEALARRLGLPMVRALRRVRPTEALWRHGREERQRLLRGAFRARTGRLARDRKAPVLLVDDILTTGSTCGAAARVLKAAGAGPVIAAVIGRAEGR